MARDPFAPPASIPPTDGDDPNGVTHALLPMRALKPHPRNYRKHPKKQLDRIALSLRRFGQVRSIVVQEGGSGRYVVVAGHGLVEAAKQEGFKELHADIIPATWSDAQVEGYLVSDNLTAQSGEDDRVTLAQILQEQKDAGFELESLGIDDGELARMLNDLADEALDLDDDEDDDEDERAPRTRTKELKQPEGGEVESSFSVLVECADEREQQRLYERLTSEGHTCRLLTV